MSLGSYVADSRMRHDSILFRIPGNPDIQTRLNLMRQNNFRIFKEHRAFTTPG